MTTELMYVICISVLLALAHKGIRRPYLHRPKESNDHIGSCSDNALPVETSTVPSRAVPKSVSAPIADDVAS